MDFAALYRAEKAKAKAKAKEDGAYTGSRLVASATPSTELNKKGIKINNQDEEEEEQRLKTYLVTDLGHGISYCDQFLSPVEADNLTQAIDMVPSSDWATLTRRRLLNLGGVPHPSGSWSEQLPKDITDLVCRRLIRMGLFSLDSPANQVLLNEYTDGAGIDTHNDGPLFDPIACIVSIGGDAVLNFYAPTKDIGSSISKDSSSSKNIPPLYSVILRANSLVVFTGEAYQTLSHGIDHCEADVIVSSVPNTDVPNTDVPSTDVPSTDVPSTCTDADADAEGDTDGGAAKAKAKAKAPSKDNSKGVAEIMVPLTSKPMTTCLNLGQANAAPGDIILRPQRRLSLTLRRLSRVDREFEGDGEYVPPDIER